MKRLKNTERNVKNKAYTTMNKLIKVAEELYKQIDKAQVHLINARLNNNEEGKESAISEIETAICNASQLLKCLIERKDNIVDLSKVFHNAAEVPNMRRDLLYDSRFCGYGVLQTMLLCEEEWSYFQRTYAIKRWAYVKDLLPKGGEK